MITWWKKLSQGDRIRVLVVGLAMLGGAYQFVIYPATHEGLQESERMVKRRLDRIAKRTKPAMQTEANPRVLASRVKRLDKQLEEVTVALDELKAGFAPVEPGTEQQRLLLEISTLARRSGVELVSIGRQDTPTTGVPVGGSHVPTVDRRLGRPLLKLSARSGYWELLDFLDGLEGLSYQVSVMRLAIRSHQWSGEERDREGSKTAPPGALNLTLTLVI